MEGGSGDNQAAKHPKNNTNRNVPNRKHLQSIDSWTVLQSRHKQGTAVHTRGRGERAKGGSDTMDIPQQTSVDPRIHFKTIKPPFTKPQTTIHPSIDFESSKAVHKRRVARAVQTSGKTPSRTEGGGDSNDGGLCNGGWY